MKQVLILTFMFCALNAFPQTRDVLEHRDGQGASPSLSRLALTRSCFRDVELLGCGDGRSDREAFYRCVDQNREHLGRNCFALMTKLYATP